jgi:hypothetical protein
LNKWSISIEIEFKCRRTAVHDSREKSNELPLHALGSCEEVQGAACFAIYLQIEEQRVKELLCDLFFIRPAGYK